MSSIVKNFIFDVYSLMDSYFNKIELVMQYKKKDKMLSFSFINDYGDTDNIYINTNQINEDNYVQLLRDIEEKLDELI